MTKENMTATERFIRDAIEGGYIIDYGSPEYRDCNASTLLDPAAWKAVGKVREWSDAMPSGRKCDDPSRVQEQFLQPGWLWRMHRLIDALAADEPIEEYLATIV